MEQAIKDAYLYVRDGHSTDRVLADPDLNAKYLMECHRSGLQTTDEELNWALLNARKASCLKGIKTCRRTSFKDEADYAFAGEIAIRFLERRDGVTLDQVICSPSRAAEFDAVASRICPGYTALRYRWAALNLRKKRRLKPERVGQVCPPIQVINSAVADLDPSTVPQRQGVYIFFDSRGTLYVGETSNLARRIAKHLDHSDNKGFARWLWDCGPDDLNVEMQLLPDSTSTRARRALEGELIESRHPAFNVSQCRPGQGSRRTD